ncbi:MAG TPA: chromate efflux transporter [Chthonomonadaceae bacterium]|nr:chromate efflux transporter [Chthonomonadaceae bacterium]
MNTHRASLPELALLFLRLGFTAFGGPAAHIAMMQQEVVEKREWLTKEEFLDLLGASNLIPGPSSTELAIHIGFRQARWMGLLLAGTCFILPAFLLVMGIAWAYVRFGHLPQAAGVLYGVKPVVIAIVVQALWNLGRTALKSRFLAGVGIVATGVAFGGISPLLVLFGAGALVGGAHWIRSKEKEGSAPLFGLLCLIAALVALPLLLGRYVGNTPTVTPASLFWVFLKFGSIVYGSGYVLLAFIRADLVARLHWLTSAQLLDAIAVGQVTPGPVFTTATFIGFLLGGPTGAVVATLGMFLPAFLFVALSGPLVTGLRKSPLAGAFLDGVNAAALALMAVVSWELGRAALVDVVTVALALLSALLLFRFRINSLWLVLLGTVVGLAVSLLRAAGWLTPPLF